MSQRATVTASEPRSHPPHLDALPVLVWLVPLAYPVAALAMARSASLIRATGVTGWVLFAASLAWALSGSFAAVLFLDYLDRTGRDRSQYRLGVSGALLGAAAPPVLVGVGVWLSWVHAGTFRLAGYYAVAALIALASLTTSPPAAQSVAGTRRLHVWSAALIALFAVVHIANHVAAIASLDAHEAIQRVLRPIYRARPIEVVLIAAIAFQVASGASMIWRVRVRRMAFRNAQMVSGLYLAAFFASHLPATLGARQQLDTTFAWATGGAAGLLDRPASLQLLPYYVLGIVALFVHLGCQARWNLARVVPVAVAHRIGYGLMAIGALAGTVVGLAACGVHLLP